MKNAFRRIGPVILILVILAACAGGGWIWYDNNIDRSGWVEEDGVRFYRDFHADPVTGWLELQDGVYYFDEGGIPAEGWREIDGVTYALEPNPMEIEWVRFDFEGQNGVFSYKNAQGEKKLPFGLGENVFSKFPQEGYSLWTASVPEEGNRYDCAASADWPEPQKLRIKVQAIDKYFGNLNMTFRFKSDEIAVLMEKNAEAFFNEYCGNACGKKASE